jgi:hypothetical protein
MLHLGTSPVIGKPVIMPAIEKVIEKLKDTET